jgi:hypothetical protein
MLSCWPSGHATHGQTANKKDKNHGHTANQKNSCFFFYFWPTAKNKKNKAYLKKTMARQLTR